MRLICARRPKILAHISLIVAHTKIHHDNSPLCIIVQKSVYMTKYLNVFCWFFYSFVLYMTLLWKCASMGMSYREQRDACFLVLTHLWFYLLTRIVASSRLGRTVTPCGGGVDKSRAGLRFVTVWSQVLKSPLGPCTS